MTKGNLNSQRGYLYTVAIIILMLPLIMLLIFYTGVSKTGIENTVANIRCDALYYFVQDIESDMERAMLISGRRAAVYAIDDVVTNGRTMANYTYTNCTDFVYPRNGSEAAIAELILCGTLYGDEVQYMSEHTLPIWFDKINNGSRGLHYVMNVSVNNMTIAMSDAWNFAITLDSNLTVHDETGLCYYIGRNFTLQSFTDIIGLEDTLYPLNTNNRAKKYIYNCSLNVTLDNIAGCSKADSHQGNGTGPGNVAFVSDFGVDNLDSFCDNPSNYGYDYAPEDMIIVFDLGIGACNQLPEDCVDITSPDHLAGIIDMGPNSPLKLSDHCNVTIPWITDTGKMDNITGHGGGWAPGCPDTRSNITQRGECILIKNLPDCDIHQVLIGYDASDLNTTCYTISNVTHYNESCNDTYLNGPSFFDRLDGRLYLSDYYKDWSVEIFGNPYIGIETLVNPYDLAVRNVPIFEEATWVDYLYWNNTPGCPVSVMCQDDVYDFNLDCQHAYYYRLSTDCNPGGVEAFSELPISWITSPANGTTYPGCPTVSINGSAEDCDGDVSYVQLLINGVPYDTTWDDPDWNYTFSPSENGIYYLQSRAVDNSLLFEEDLDQRVLIFSGCGGDNDPPSTPTLNGPCEATRVASTTQLDWNPASDESGIFRYEVELNETSANPPEVSYDYSTSSPYTVSGLNGCYLWKVRAQDNAGNWGDWSSSCRFTTKNGFNQC